MAKPLLVVAARSRTLRRLVSAAAGLIVFTIFAILAPLVTVPAVLAGQAMTASSGRPMMVGEWGYPLAGDYFNGRGFGWYPVDGCSYCSKDHKGYDMSQECGATIYAAGPGTVIRAGGGDGLGNAVQIDHGGGVSTVYGHMMWDSLRVSPGTTVMAGTPLGLEGNTGASFGCHLHFEIRVDGVRVDPEPFMADRGLPLK